MKTVTTERQTATKANRTRAAAQPAADAVANDASTLEGQRRALADTATMARGTASVHIVGGDGGS